MEYKDLVVGGLYYLTEVYGEKDIVRVTQLIDNGKIVIGFELLTEDGLSKTPIFTDRWSEISLTTANWMVGKYFRDYTKTLVANELQEVIEE